MCFLVLLTENVEFLTHASVILLRGAQTLTFLYTVSILQPSPHTNIQGSGTLFVQFVSFVDGEKVYVAWRDTPSNFPINLMQRSKFMVHYK